MVAQMMNASREAGRTAAACLICDLLTKQRSSPTIQLPGCQWSKPSVRKTPSKCKHKLRRTLELLCSCPCCGLLSRGDCQCFLLLLLLLLPTNWNCYNAAPQLAAVRQSCSMQQA